MLLGKALARCSLVDVTYSILESLLGKNCAYLNVLGHEVMNTNHRNILFGQIKSKIADLIEFLWAFAK